MKTYKTINRLFLFCLSLCMVSIYCSAQDGGNMVLPKPQLDKGRPLMQVLKDRKSTRVFSPEKLTPQDLSNILWAGFGINRPETNGRTAPSAMNEQEIDVYVTLPEGLYLYDAKNNLLKKINNKDIRALTGNQDFVKDAGANIVFVADYSRTKNGDHNDQKLYAVADAAFISENMYLYCASEGFATVVRAYINKPELAKAMGLKPVQEIIFAQTIGYKVK
jgi:SagB-type dehydrogenase family enzyme